MTRRGFLGAVALAAGPMPIIDTHIHLFDPTRPQGVPWPDPKNETLYKPALPGRYRTVAGPFGITGAIAVECSPLAEDNQWLLDAAARDPVIVGVVGNLEPDDAAFGKRLETLRRNPLFLGIRYGNLWGRDLGAQLAKPRFVDGMRAAAAAGLALDSANPNEALLGALLRLKREVPDLRLVIDHLPQMNLADDRYPAVLSEIARLPAVWIKISEVLRRVDGRVRLDHGFYKTRLDALFELFGPDRVMYGSDWPNSDQWAPYKDVFDVVRNYMDKQEGSVRERFFWKNSVAAYRWKKRQADQPGD
ncbi:MAG: amidohydrolase family protein [Bryobacterales bacterium]|nr:amidohydrolase family protein [Bryobacterales bacterium]